jgi:hypothetical protein
MRYDVAVCDGMHRTKGRCYFLDAHAIEDDLSVGVRAGDTLAVDWVPVDEYGDGVNARQRVIEEAKQSYAEFEAARR